MDSIKAQQQLPLASSSPVVTDLQVARQGVPQRRESQLDNATSERFVANFAHAKAVMGSAAGPALDATTNTEIHRGWDPSPAGVGSQLGMIELDMTTSERGRSQRAGMPRVTVAIVCAVTLAVAAIGLARMGRSTSLEPAEVGQLSLHALDGPRIIANGLVAPRSASAGSAVATEREAVLASKGPSNGSGKASASGSASSPAKAADSSGSFSPARLDAGAAGGNTSKQGTPTLAKSVPASARGADSGASAATKPDGQSVVPTDEGAKFSALPPPPEDVIAPQQPAQGVTQSSTDAAASPSGPQVPDPAEDASS